MAKFVLVKNYEEFDKIKEYVKNKVMSRFYITPKLLYKLIKQSGIKCCVGVNLDDIKLKSYKDFDIICTLVLARSYENEAFRVDAIKINGTLCKLAMPIDDDVIFGGDREYPEYLCLKFEML